ncbi:helix-turn-helix domain-containing protein [Actinomadura oligospora]|uniref:helix-turn-helix domain-containing protein n=1 Tax=Actinomadura oligospora TaxID=111804 RepID=UPI0004AFA666|nr:helix-turn-helix domain-containing protein [Actinomadura oligospora]
MQNRNIDPADPRLGVGQRIQFFRTRRGMSRGVLGGLVGRNGRWIKAVERGDIGEPKLPDLVRLADALKLGDVAKLTGGAALPTKMFKGPGHPALAAVRDAINSVSLGTTGPPSSLAHLEARLDAAWRARHAAPDHRTVLGALLPDLIRDAKRAARAYEGAERRRALATLAGVYNLAQFFIAYQPAADLLWRVVERSVMAAEESESPVALAGAVWLATQAHRDVDDFDAAEAVCSEALELIRPHVDDGPLQLRALYGALHAEAAYTAARDGQVPTAWRWWDEADEIAKTLPKGFYEPMTSFSRAVMPAHAVTVAVEGRKAGEARRQAVKALKAAPIPSQPRRGRHLIEVARAYQLAGDPAEALGTLDAAYTTAPETIRFNSHARRMVDEATRGPAGLRQDAHDLADRIGLLV